MQPTRRSEREAQPAGAYARRSIPRRTQRTAAPPCAAPTEGGAASYSRAERTLLAIQEPRIPCRTVCACVRAGMPACVRVHSSVYALRARSQVRGRMCACVCACVRACVCMCVGAQPEVEVRTRLVRATSLMHRSWSVWCTELMIGLPCVLNDVLANTGYLRSVA